MQANTREDIFRQDALSTRFHSFPCKVEFPCPLNSPTFTAPAMGPVDPKGVIGMATNNDILHYQFMNTQDIAFCGVPLASQPQVDPTLSVANCSTCPCSSAAIKESETCNYGFARNHASIMGPFSGNRKAGSRWG